MEVVTLSGGPRDRGRQHGERFAAEIEANVERYLDRFAHYGVDGATARQMATKFVTVIEEADAVYAEEMAGIADGSGIPLTDIALLNARYEVLYGALADTATAAPDADEDTATPPADGCTSFAVDPAVTATGTPYVGQNWDWMPDVDVFVMHITGDADAGDDSITEHVAVTEAGIVGGKLGVNAHGIALGLNGLVTAADGDNPFRIPYHVRFRNVFRADSLQAAVAAVVDAPRACSANVVLGAPSGEFVNLEVLPDTVASSGPTDGVLTHANHLETATASDSQFEELLPDTLCRAPRLRQLLTDAAPTITDKTLMSVLADHENHPQSICRHLAGDTPQEEQLMTRVSAIINLSERSLTVTDGVPCETTYHSVTIGDDV